MRMCPEFIYPWGLESCFRYNLEEEERFLAEAKKKKKLH